MLVKTNGSLKARKMKQDQVWRLSRMVRDNSECNVRYRVGVGKFGPPLAYAGNLTADGGGLRERQERICSNESEKSL